MDILVLVEFREVLLDSTVLFHYNPGTVIVPDQCQHPFRATRVCDERTLSFRQVLGVQRGVWRVLRASMILE